MSEELFEELAAGLPAGHGAADVAAREPDVAPVGPDEFDPFTASRADLREQLARLAALRAGRARMAALSRAERDVSAIPVTVQVDLRRRRSTS